MQEVAKIQKFYQVEVLENSVEEGKKYSLLNGTLDVGYVTFEKTQIPTKVNGTFYIDVDQVMEYRFRPMYTEMGPNRGALYLVDMIPM